MPFADALEATAARGGEMANLDLDDNGKMAAVLAPMAVVEQVLGSVDGYVIPANINSHSQCVFGGASDAVEQAVAQFEADGYKAMIIPVSHAFHTEIIAPAGVMLRNVLDRLNISEPQLPIVANVTGGMYPTTPTAIKDNLQTQVSSTVQWVKGLHTLYDYGVRMFVEVGPKRALRGFANDVFAGKDDVIALLTNHPKQGALPTFNQALCGLYAAGYEGVAAEQYSVDSEQFTVNSEQFAVDSGQFTVNSGQFTVNSEQFAVNSERFTVDSGQFAVDSGQFTVNSDQFTVNSGQFAEAQQPAAKPAPKMEPAPEPVKIEKAEGKMQHSTGNSELGTVNDEPVAAPTEPAEVPATNHQPPATSHHCLQTRRRRHHAPPRCYAGAATAVRFVQANGCGAGQAEPCDCGHG